jgi:hypothetical protein
MVTSVLAKARAHFAQAELGWPGVAIVYGLLVGAKLMLATGAVSAFIFGDELLYKTAAFELTQSHTYSLAPNPYPPLYPLALTPAFLFGDDWYSWILRVNIFLSTLAIVPVWLIARELLDARRAALAALLSGVLPYHVVFPRMVFSENLYVPLFLAGIYLVVTERRWPVAPRSVALGLILGFSQLTRHLNLVVIPVFVACYLVFRRHDLHADARWSITIRHLVLTTAGFALVYAPWLLYSFTQTGDLDRAIGVGVAGEQLGRRALESEALLRSLGPWIALYSLTVVLLVAPYAPALLSHPWWVGKTTQPLRRLTVIVALATGACTLAATVFLWLYFADRWDQTYIEERYITAALPLVPVIVLAILGRQPPNSRRWLPVTCVAILSFVAYAVLLDDRVWPGHPNTSNPVTSPHLASLFSAPGSAVNVSAIALSLSVFLTWLATQSPRKLASATFAAGLLILYVVAAWQLTSAMDVAQQRALHGRAISQALTILRNDERVTLVPIRADPSVVDIPPAPILAEVVRFWGQPSGTFFFPSDDDTSAVGGLFLTPVSYPSPIVSYHVLGREYFLYKTPITGAVALTIEQYAPAEVRAGEPFNIQPDGSSAAWIRATGATASTIVVLGGVAMRTLYVDSTLLTFTVPSGAYAVPGVYDIVLRDAATNRMSNRVSFTVR